MGRRKMGWEELKARGCKPSRYLARKREQEAPPPEPEVTIAKAPFVPNPDAVQTYLAAVKREWDTCSDRCVEGEILTRQYGSGFPWPDAGGQDYAKHGARFRFAEGPFRSVTPNLLQACKDFAEESLAREDCGEWAKELCSRFLRDLSTLNEFVFDCEAARNVERMLDTFNDSENFIPMLRKVPIIEFMCWKHRDTGEPRFPDEELLNFNDQDIVVMDRAFEAQQQAFGVAA